ncbi:hypothetical protein [Vagococcus intermedius]|uniref:hypothetical protein n=1 Tax=Vagococcus intermedius TaxID=2991418 RepID=UPI0023B830AE|nr:hypothetical protein [Vagococcus intermedius]WEG74997.1 hypothetical protein OL235_07995 [Vagococcus intermedius]
MSCQLVAGTVILSSSNGEKKFLVKKTESDFDFITTSMNDEITSLASILQELKTEAMMDVSSIDLVELTNVSIDEQKMPLFVFEMNEISYQKNEELGNGFTWETPKTFREVLTKFNVSGVPIFE